MAGGPKKAKKLSHHGDKLRVEEEVMLLLERDPIIEGMRGGGVVASSTNTGVEGRGCC